MWKRSVLIAECNITIRTDFIEPLLMERYNIVASVGDGNEAVLAAIDRKPAIALLDVSLPGLNGFQAARRILAKHPACRIVIVSIDPSPAYVTAARNLGAGAYVTKANIVHELLHAMKVASRGRFYQSQTPSQIVRP